MPQFDVPLAGGGSMQVNASDPAAAAENVQVQGGTPASSWGGVVASSTSSSPGNPQQQNPGNAQQQYGAAIQQMLDAVASGNAQAFDESVRRFNATFGLQEAGITGTYQGNPTFPALTSYANQFGQWGVPQQGQQTLAAQGQYFTQGLQGIQTAAGLQANPFRQQQVLGQLGGLYGGQGVAGFQAPNVVQGVGTAGGNTRGGLGYLQQMIDDIKDPTANSASMNQVLDATPTPNKLNSAEFMRSAPSTQSMVLQAMQEKYGLDPNDSLRQIQNTLPQFRAPSTMGGIKR